MTAAPSGAHDHRTGSPAWAQPVGAPGAGQPVV